MDRNFALAIVLATAAAGNAFAEGPIMDNTPFVSSASRAGVKAELAAFRASGVDPWADEYNQLTAFRSSKSRAEVMAEFALTRAESAAYNAEDSGSSYMARAVNPNARMTRMAGR